MADKFLIKKRVQLSGDVAISGYKNSAGAVLAAVLLSKEPSIIDNLPLVSDILDQIEILKQMGAEVKWLSERKIKINEFGNEYDINQEIKENILLSLPLNFLCKIDCKGLCQNCGQNLNLRNCNCIKTNLGFTFAELKKIKYK